MVIVTATVAVALGERQSLTFLSRLGLNSASGAHAPLEPAITSLLLQPKRATHKHLQSQVRLKQHNRCSQEAS